MNYGLYLSASGVLANLYRQDVFANNLANVETAGFRPDVPMIRQRDAEVVEDELGHDVSQHLLDRLGGGVLAGPQYVSSGAGPLHQTGNPLDVALQDKSSFFAVQKFDEQSGRVAVCLTRDGRFTLDSEGRLVTQSGHAVLGPGDEPISIPRGVEVKIDQAGRIRSLDGAMIGRLQVATVEDGSVLRKQGQNLLSFEGHDPRTFQSDSLLKPGYIETSGVDPIKSVLQLTAATKAAMGNAKMIQYFDLLMDRSVNTFGRIA